MLLPIPLTLRLLTAIVDAGVDDGDCCNHCNRGVCTSDCERTQAHLSICEARPVRLQRALDHDPQPCRAPSPFESWLECPCQRTPGAHLDPEWQKTGIALIMPSQGVKVLKASVAFLSFSPCAQYGSQEYYPSNCKIWLRVCCVELEPSVFHKAKNHLSGQSVSPGRLTAPVQFPARNPNSLAR